MVSLAWVLTTITERTQTSLWAVRLIKQVTTDLEVTSPLVVSTHMVASATPIMFNTKRIVKVPREASDRQEAIGTTK